MNCYIVGFPYKLSKSDQFSTFLDNLIDESTESFDFLDLDDEFMSKNEDYLRKHLRVKVGTVLTRWYFGSTLNLESLTSYLQAFSSLFLVVADSQSLMTIALILWINYDAVLMEC